MDYERRITRWKLGRCRAVERNMGGVVQSPRQKLTNAGRENCQVCRQYARWRMHETGNGLEGSGSSGWRGTQ